jgi:ribosome-associated protein|tara:strand:+ start:897 stop:1244 length:348 start_codon:yes stop_codon:yes gene_type:complete
MEISAIKNKIEKILDNNKAKNIVSIDLKKKSYIADYMIIASGTSSRHLQSLSENLVFELKKIGIYNCRMEGKDSLDWKLVDAIDIIIHIFHPEKREFYDLEKMWSEPIPKEKILI